MSIAGANSLIDFQGGTLKLPNKSPIASLFGGNMSLSTVSASDHSQFKADTSVKRYKLSSPLPPGQQTLFGGSVYPHINDRVNIAIADLICSNGLPSSLAKDDKFLKLISMCRSLPRKFVLPNQRKVGGVIGCYLQRKLQFFDEDTPHGVKDLWCFCFW